MAAPQAPIVAPNVNAPPLTINGANFPARTAPSTPKGASAPDGLTVNGKAAPDKAAPSELKGGGTLLTISGSSKAPAVAPSATAAPQGPSSSDGRR
jgi:hypothetical protein